MDDPGTSRQPERNGRAKDLCADALNADKADDSDTCTPDAEGDRRANDLGEGADNPGGEVNNSDTGR